MSNVQYCHNHRLLPYGTGLATYHETGTLRVVTKSINAAPSMKLMEIRALRVPGTSRHDVKRYYSSLVAVQLPLTNTRTAAILCKTVVFAWQRERKVPYSVKT